MYVLRFNFTGCTHTHTHTDMTTSDNPNQVYNYTYMSCTQGHNVIIGCCIYKGLLSAHSCINQDINAISGSEANTVGHLNPLLSRSKSKLQTSAAKLSAHFEAKTDVYHGMSQQERKLAMWRLVMQCLLSPNASTTPSLYKLLDSFVMCHFKRQLQLRT